MCCAIVNLGTEMTGNPFWLTDSSYFLDSSRFNETIRAEKSRLYHKQAKGNNRKQHGEFQLLAMRKVYFS